MKTVQLHSLPGLWLLVVSILFSQTAGSQGFYGNPYYADPSAGLGAQMQQYQTNINQILINFESQYSEELHRLHQEYVQSSGIQIPYWRFVYYYAASGGGRNPQAVIRQQEAMTGAIQRGNQSLQNQFDDNYRSWQQNQQIMDRVQENTIDSIQGNSLYYNPYTGQAAELPYGPQGYEGGYYYDGEGEYLYGQDGAVYQVPPGGYPQPMEELYDSEMRQFFGEE